MGCDEERMATRWLSISKCWYRRNRVSMWSFDQFWCYYGYQRHLTRKRKHYKTLFVLTQVSNFFRQFSFKGLTVLMHSFKSAVVKLQFCWFWLDEDERHTFFRSHFRIAIEQTRWISDPLKNIKMRHFGMIFKHCDDGSQVTRLRLSSLDYSKVFLRSWINLHHLRS